MRRPIIALAAAACLATAACTTTDPADTPSPTEVATVTVEATEPAMSEAPGDEAETSQESTPASGPNDSDTTAEDVDLADQTFAVTPQQAIDKGLAEAGDGIVHSIELDWSDSNNAWVYELDILAGNVDHDVDVHADTGDILEHEQDDTDDQEQAINLDSPMTWETARDKALEAVPGRITSWKLEWDDDYTSYQFDIEDSTGDEIEVEVRVDTGQVSIDD